jgi:large subunit ribosomal protein L1
MAKAKNAAKDTTKDAADSIDETIVDAQQTEVVEEKTEVSTKEVATAKAGKRSAKAIKEVEELQAKEERKALTAEEQAEADARPKQVAKPTRSRLERQGKKFRDAAKLVDRTKLYSIKEALDLVKKTSPVKFDASVEIHVNLSVDPRHADQNIRDNLVLPAGTGRSVRVAVFGDETVDGADISGVETITQQLDKGEINFDILIATPAQMPKLGRYARVLGPRGLMPNPKSGTVTTDVAKAVREAKAGRVEYRVDSTGIVHLLVGKVSFSTANLQQNIQAVLASVKANKPASVKGTYVKAVHLTTSMGPSIPVAVSEV